MKLVQLLVMNENNNVHLLLILNIRNVALLRLRLLCEKHGEQFLTEQFHAWSQLGKHASHDKPLDYPFFRTSKKKSIHSAESSPSATATTPTKSTAPAVGISSGRQVNLRTECLQQLKQLGELLKNGSISPDQHQKLKEAIMSVIYKL